MVDRGARRRWLARASILLVCVAVILLLVFAIRRSAWLLTLTLLGIVVMVGSSYLALARRGAFRLTAAAVLAATPIALAWLFVSNELIWAVIGVVLAGGLSLATGRAALTPTGDHRAAEREVPRPRQPFVVMNPRSGGGKVGRFGLREKAEALGAHVVVLEEPGIDVEQLARDAVCRGADLLGVAGGDGTQALVAGVAAELDVPFMVISAGTRNHFALDLGLDRRDPSTCLAALTDDAVETRVDLATVSGRTFVNNASFGAYATVVQSPAYRGDKARTTLDMLPDLLVGHRGPRLSVLVNGAVIEGPQAVLVSDNPYGMGDVVGLGRRPRIDRGLLGVVVVTVDNVGQAVRLLARGGERGLTVCTAHEVVVTADVPSIPVGVDGEALVLPTPVRCTIRPLALRVRVPRDRPGVPSPRARWDLPALLRLASSRRQPVG